VSATKILWGQITIVVLIVLFTTWGATQWTAWQLGFQPQLGRPWFMLAGWPIYYPPAFFWWWYFYDAYAPSVFVEGAFIAASGGFVSIAVAIPMSVWRAREAKTAETYGSARWAETREVKAAGLLGADGVVLGKLERDYLRHDGPEHAVFRTDPLGKGRRPGRAVASDLAGVGDRPRHQG
jgi:type IV secretion system protein VirD4